MANMFGVREVTEAPLSSARALSKGVETLEATTPTVGTSYYEINPSGRAISK
jgi:hypothetical protein